MLRQLAVCAIVSLATIAIHAVVTTLVIAAARGAVTWSARHARAWLVAIMAITVGILMLAHVAEIMAWAFAYRTVRATPVGADSLYFAFVNYTTLGYGDVLPVARWRMLGPAAAMNGILMFGWSTAVIFEVLRSAVAIQETGNPSAPPAAPVVAPVPSSAGTRD